MNYTQHLSAKGALKLILLSFLLFGHAAHSGAAFTIEIKGFFGPLEPQPFANQAFSFFLESETDRYDSLLEVSNVEYNVNNITGNEFTGLLRVGSAFVDFADADSNNFSFSNNRTIGPVDLGDNFGVSVLSDTGLSFGDEERDEAPGFEEIKFISAKAGISDESGQLFNESIITDEGFVISLGQAPRFGTLPPDDQELSPGIWEDLDRDFTVLVESSSSAEVNELIRTNSVVTSIIATGTIESIDVTIVPLPAAAWLLISALGVLGIISRKKHS